MVAMPLARAKLGLALALDGAGAVATALEVGCVYCTGAGTNEENWQKNLENFREKKIAQS